MRAVKALDAASIERIDLNRLSSFLRPAEAGPPGQELRGGAGVESFLCAPHSRTQILDLSRDQERGGRIGQHHIANRATFSLEETLEPLGTLCGPRHVEVYRGDSRQAERCGLPNVECDLSLLNPAHVSGAAESDFVESIGARDNRRAADAKL